MNEAAPFLYKTFVGEAFRLPWDGKPVPYGCITFAFYILFVLRQFLLLRFYEKYGMMTPS